MDKILGKLAEDIDAATDLRDVDELRQCTERCETMLKSAKDVDQPLIYYFQANANSAIRGIKSTDETYIFNWIQPEYTNVILALRQSVRHPHFVHLDPIRRCQIYTNLGNALDAVGRPIEAIEMWDEALQVIPAFAMARGNRGKGLFYYSGALYDAGHRGIFLMQAKNDFRTAISPGSPWDSVYPNEVREKFQQYANEIEEYLERHFDESKFEPYKWTLGTTEDEQKYRKWRLENRLFINPLNDLEAWPIAAHDIFHLPDHVYRIDERPRFVQYFDSLKQEYVAACLLLYEGIQVKSEHYADKGNQVFEHCDGSIGGLRIEKQKMAFRSAYSILDKIAMFLNEYYDLGKDSRRLNFRTVWHDGKKISSRIPQKNWRLRGLYALSLDLFDNEFKETALPHSELLNDVRNAAEHRFLQVYEDGSIIQSDHITTRVERAELYRVALRMLKIARAALIYLSLSMYHQENVVSPTVNSEITNQWMLK